jgi:hypothetical protein
MRRPPRACQPTPFQPRHQPLYYELRVRIAASSVLAALFVIIGTFLK